MNVRIQLTIALISLFVLPQNFSAQSKEYKKDQKRTWAEANCFYEAEDYEMALTLYANIYLLDEDYDEINFRMGTCYFNIPDEKNKSISYFKKAKEAGYTEAYFWLARAYHVEEQFSQAKKNYQVYKSKEDKLLVEKEVDRYVDIVRRALEAPIRTIVANAGGEGSVVVAKVSEGKKDFGYDAKKEEYVDMLKAGIIDPKKVTRIALENAASVAGMILTTECALVDIKEESPAAAMPPMGGGMPGGMPGMM